jgi:hypothetical protein
VSIYNHHVDNNKIEKPIKLFYQEYETHESKTYHYYKVRFPEGRKIGTAKHVIGKWFYFV